MIQYGINTFLWASPFQTKDLQFLDQAKALGFDLVEIPIEGAGDVITTQRPRHTRAPGWPARSAP